MNSHILQNCPRIFFIGVGGQGTLTATRLLAEAALLADLQVISGEVHGMAQRGGIVESALLLGGWNSPRIAPGEADIILGFEPLETYRALPFLTTGGAVFSSLDPIYPLSVSLGHGEYPDIKEIMGFTHRKTDFCHFISCNALGKQAGSEKSGAVALLGALCASGIIPIAIEHLALAISKNFKSEIAAINIRAMNLGAKTVPYSVKK